MSDLDAKLKEIKGTVTSHLYKSKSDAELWQSEITIQLTDNVIAQIKQVFTDAGWRDMRSNNQAVTYGGYLSGQEWYDRFQHNIKPKQRKIWLGTPYVRVRAAVEAAKRASGIE